MPPNSSGRVRPNTPSSAIWAIDLERECSCWCGASRARAAPPRCRRSCASPRGWPRASRRAPQSPTVAPCCRAHQLDQAGAVLGRVAGRDQRRRAPATSAPRSRRHRGRDRRAARSRPGSSGCRRRSGRGIRRAPMRTISSSVSPNRPASRHPLRIGGELAHRLDIGREPGEPMGGALLALEPACPTVRPSTRDAVADLAGGVGEQRFGAPRSPPRRARSDRRPSIRAGLRHRLSARQVTDRAPGSAHCCTCHRLPACSAQFARCAL